MVKEETEQPKEVVAEEDNYDDGFDGFDDEPEKTVEVKVEEQK